MKQVLYKKGQAINVIQYMKDQEVKKAIKTLIIEIKLLSEQVNKKRKVLRELFADYFEIKEAEKVEK